MVVASILLRNIENYIDGCQKSNQYFKSNSHLPRSCNVFFITLEPKMHNPIGLEEYMPISLVQRGYKII